MTTMAGADCQHHGKQLRCGKMTDVLKDKKHGPVKPKHFQPSSASNQEGRGRYIFLFTYKYFNIYLIVYFVVLRQGLGQLGLALNSLCDEGNFKLWILMPPPPIPGLPDGHFLSQPV